MVLHSRPCSCSFFSLSTSYFWLVSLSLPYAFGVYFPPSHSHFLFVISSLFCPPYTVFDPFLHTFVFASISLFFPRVLYMHLFFYHFSFLARLYVICFEAFSYVFVLIFCFYFLLLFLFFCVLMLQPHTFIRCFFINLILFICFPLTPALLLFFISIFFSFSPYCFLFVVSLPRSPF